MSREVCAVSYQHPSYECSAAERGGQWAEEGWQRIPRGSLLPNSPLPRIPTAAPRGGWCVWESGTRSRLPVSSQAKKGGPQRRGALRRPREAGVAGVRPPPPLRRGALARAKRGELARGGAGPARGAWSPGLARPAPGRGAAVADAPRPGASLPDPGQPPVGPGARSLPGRAARAMAAAALASGAPFGPALELLPGQPAPARARPVSAGPAPRSWLGSASGSRPTGGAEGAVRRPGNQGAAQSGGAGGRGRERNGFDIPPDLRRQGKHTRSCTGLSRALGRRCSRSAVRRDECPAFPCHWFLQCWLCLRWVLR